MSTPPSRPPTRKRTAKCSTRSRSAARSLRKFAEAKQLREASLALAEKVSGAQSADYAMALVRLGDLARRYGTLEESNEYYQRALALGDRPEVFPALMRLGLSTKDPEKSRDYLDRARYRCQERQ